MITLSEEQIHFLNSTVRGHMSVKGDWHINPDTGLVDVTGSVIVSAYSLNDKLLVNFGIVSGDFSVLYNNLKTLEGSPYLVGGMFHCASNLLTSLKFAPKRILGKFICDSNPIKSLDFEPEELKYMVLDFTKVYEEDLCIIIPEIEALIEKGVTVEIPYGKISKYINDYHSRLDKKFISLI